MSVDVSHDEIRAILVNDQLFAVDAADFADDTPLTLDSLAMVWLVHRLREEYGADVDPERIDVTDFASVNAIHALVERMR